MGKWLVPRHGATEEFLRANLSAETDQCIEWPYARDAKGYGLAVVGGKQRKASNWMCRLAHGEPFLIWKVAAHRCGNPPCVNPRHLRWATERENAADRKVHGTDNSGERNGKSWITEEDVQAIRAAPPFLGPLAAKYGLSKRAICHIRSGRSWKHVKSPPVTKIGRHTHCRNGHAYDEANTRWRGGYRQCRACDREHAKKRRAVAKPDAQKGSAS